MQVLGVDVDLVHDDVEYMDIAVALPQADVVAARASRVVTSVKGSFMAGARQVGLFMADRLPG